MDLGLAGKVALVAAGTSGIGLGVATALVREGAAVEICGRSPDRLDAAVAELTAVGAGSVMGSPVDLRDDAAVAAWVAAVVARHGRIDIVVANSGGPAGGQPSELSVADFSAGFETSYLPLVRVVQAALPQVRQAQDGRIVIISSYAVRQPVAGLTLSNSIRPGLVGYAKSLVSELGDNTVTVNVVAVGMTRTAALDEYDPKLMGELTRDVPLGRMAEPIEIGDAVAYLASSRAAYITGAVLPVDGGAVRALL